MGCVQTKSGMNSPPGGLEKLKMENGYAGREGIMRHRRSTGQRYSEGKPGQVYVAELPGKRNGFGSADGGGGGGGRGKVVGGEGEKGRGNGYLDGWDEVVDGWPKWLTDNVPREVLAGLVPRSAESYDKIDKVGQGTYSNVYKARDRETGKIVALKKVRFDTSEPESVQFMAREIMILQKLNHPNIVKLEGLATSRMQYSIYLVFDFMQSDLARIISRPEERLTEPQIKCYMLQLLSGLQHCHERGILHRDIKGSNLLIDKNGMLKIADFGLANFYSPRNRHPLTSRVVTLWYRAPELLLGAKDYGVGIDLWSAGCLLAEMFTGRPIMPGRNEVEQLHKIFKLCGAPSEEYWKKLRLSSTFRPPRSYKPSFVESFREFPESALGFLTTLLALDPEYRGCASLALQNEFFYTSPQACDLSGLPVIYNQDHESTIPNIERRKWNSKRRHLSRTRREPSINDGVTAGLSQQNTAFPEEEPEKTAEPNVQGRGAGSSNSSSSSGSKPLNRTESSRLLLSPLTSSQQRVLARNQDPSKSSRNRPPLPTSQTRAINSNKENGTMYRLNQVSRTASTREFRKVNQRKHLEVYAVDT
ncbi:hypothetical protein SLA2020_463960 [Shorea laevis]